ncbi:UTRA domain-containing protein [Nocardiopsis mangrovi]|uniref:UTRA domain-containing protein n=1 Tax=Nocardiopsis mangrovi TaxID=1179818 RepID=A0ABV9DW61_9ACTN
MTLEEARQLEAPPGIVALVQEETAYRDGRPVSFTQTVYRFDAVRLTDRYTPRTDPAPEA